MKCFGVVTLIALVALPMPAHPKNHLWDSLRVFSNAAGNIQFINMFVSDPAGTEEYLFGNTTITTNANTYAFPNHLPMTHSTFLTWVLIATQDYADQPNAPTPDYIIPPNFFDPAGDSINYRGTTDVFVIPPGAMPTDGVRMLVKDLSTPVNLAENFAGVEGTLIKTFPAPTLPGGPVVAAALLLLLLGGVALRRRTRAR